LPRLNGVDVPSTAPWLPGAVRTGATLLTTTWKVVGAETPPSLSVTVTLTVKVPLSANVWLKLIPPWAPTLKLLFVVSPQLTFTVQGLSFTPASVKLPRLKGVLV